ncbi:Predicted arabinose efflux permease, MFS family [Fulvimarina manganoxydans]|uniref:Predicted arabinose efflux permease, MFS family n=1 Tax=Fulvimarina manganoxydans TaxID=937218 RepID=A0A1W2E5K5_9HYPH|nr:MFS transporter [Fulvimarina manganoxydans]SMD04606.1 Predicted arabinose efflux permease, MFS family [Fulvimarina manganoxydans]
MRFSTTILPIAALLTSTFFLMAGAGLMGILLPVRGSIEGWSSYEIGLFGTSYAIAFMAGCVFIPWVVRSAGFVRTFAALNALLAISVLLCAIVVHPLAWIAFRAMTGFGLAGTYMIVESWLNERVTNETRGQIYSVYMITTMAAMMGGQYVLPFSQPELTIPFMLCAILFALAVIPTTLSRAQSPAPLTNVKLDVLMLFRNSPVAAVGTILAGVLSGAWNNMAPVFGQQIGLSTAEIASIVVVAMAGGIAFQIPLGRISDRVDRRYVMVATGAIGVAAAFAGVQFSGLGASIVFAVSFVVGGVVYPAYSLAVAHANDHAADADFIKISSGLLILYGVGTMVGPLYAASLMDAFGPAGIFQSIGSAAALYAAYAFYRTFRRVAPPVSERSDFQAVPLARTQTPVTLTLDPRAEAALEAESVEMQAEKDDEMDPASVDDEDEPDADLRDEVMTRTAD